MTRTTEMAAARDTRVAETDTEVPEPRAGEDTHARPVTAAERRALDGTPGVVDRVATWLGWHVIELTAVTMLALLTVVVTWWVAPVTVAVVALWAANSTRLRRQQRRAAALRAQRQRERKAASHRAAENGGDAGDGEQSGEVSA